MTLHVMIGCRWSYACRCSDHSVNELTVGTDPSLPTHRKHRPQHRQRFDICLEWRNDRNVNGQRVGHCAKTDFTQVVFFFLLVELCYTTNLGTAEQYSPSYIRACTDRQADRQTYRQAGWQQTHLGTQT